MAHFITQVLFLMDWDKVELHKNTKREQSQYQVILTNLGQSRIYYMTFHAFMSLFVFTFMFASFCCKTYSWNQHCFLCFHSWWRFRFSCFLVPSWQRIYKKSFIFLWKIFCERKLSWTHLVVGKILLGEQNRQYHSTLPPWVANQSPWDLVHLAHSSG